MTAAIGNVLRDIESQSTREYLPLMGPEKCAFVEKLVAERQPCTVVEVGVLVGYVTVRVARNLGTACHIIGVEMGEDLARRAESNVALAGLSDKATIIRGDASEKINDIHGPIDMVILDADRASYLHYLKMLEPKLSPAAVVIANGASLNAEQLAHYLSYVRTSGKYESSLRVFGDDALEVSEYLG
jgi:predicted O-methyltransferase YrrM